MIMKILDFAAKWMFFTDAGRAQGLSPIYFPNAASVAKEQVAIKFPSDPTAPFPVADGDANSMKPQSFSDWLSSNSLPKKREASFVALTNLSLSVWAQPLAAFR